jgi:tRNA (guanine37-N1)-methyltransferase
MRVDFLTIFPRIFEDVLEQGLLFQGRQKGLLEFYVHDLRDFTHDRHRSVDDVPYGGGPGMVFKPEPIFEALDVISVAGAQVILPSPQGEVFTRQIAETLAKFPQLIFICGRYEGVDERVREAVVNRELSIGDFVTMGGEFPSLVMVEAIARFVPGVVGCQESVAEDSFQQSLLDFPHYTRPEEYRGKRVPEILLSGHHEQIRRWRRKMALQRTVERRPDLLKRSMLTEEDQVLLSEIESERKESEIKY